MKFRCTLTVDLDMPQEKKEDMARAAFIGFTAGLFMKFIPGRFIADYKFISCEAKKIPRKKERKDKNDKN